MRMARRSAGAVAIASLASVLAPVALPAVAATPVATRDGPGTAPSTGATSPVRPRCRPRPGPLAPRWPLGRRPARSVRDHSCRPRHRAGGRDRLDGPTAAEGTSCTRGARAREAGPGS